ncbi:MAG: VWA domain-containing protein, partial [Gammaproteobacteria bacterium]|nr:VWA domain-containing protein [Gammaproteobacteria bacterium]
LLAGGLSLGCSNGNGIDRDDTGSSGNSGGSGSLDDDSPADASYVKLDKLDYASEQPSIISILLRARDRDNKPVDTLTVDNFEIREDGEPLPASESASTLVAHEFLPYTLDTVIMLDVSSSISNADLANMKQAVNQLVRDPTTGNSRLLSGQRVAVYTFDDSVSEIKGFSTNPASIVNALESIVLPVSITPTDLYGAVTTGIGLWQTGTSINNIHDGAVVLITDGTDTAGRSSLSSTVKAIGDKKVFAIGVGEEVNEEVLDELGSAADYSVSSFAELGTVLSSVREQLRRYTDSYYFLQYASPKRAAEGKVSKSDHEFEVRVVDNKNKGDSGKISGEFNSYDFSNVSPRVAIGGPGQLEAGQQAVYVADTFWSISTPVYSWQLGGNCTLDDNSGSTVSLTATNAGTCQLSVMDNANGDVLTNTTINVVFE